MRPLRVRVRALPRLPKPLGLASASVVRAQLAYFASRQPVALADGAWRVLDPPPGMPPHVTGTAQINANQLVLLAKRNSLLERVLPMHLWLYDAAANKCTRLHDHPTRKPKPPTSDSTDMEKEEYKQSMKSLKSIALNSPIITNRAIDGVVFLFGESLIHNGVGVARFDTNLKPWKGAVPLFDYTLPDIKVGRIADFGDRVRAVTHDGLIYIVCGTGSDLDVHVFDPATNMSTKLKTSAEGIITQEGAGRIPARKKFGAEVIRTGSGRTVLVVVGGNTDEESVALDLETMQWHMLEPASGETDPTTKPSQGVIKVDDHTIACLGGESGMFSKSTQANLLTID